MTAIGLWVLLGASAMVTVWALVSLLRNKPFDDPLFYAVAVLELVLIISAVIGIVALSRTAREVDAATFVSYLVTAVLLPPIAALWGASDRTRWGTGVIALTGLVEAVVAVRLFDVWTLGGV
ncbi:MAG: hypothetical protein H0V23_05730 [Nocardioidaceae bacterium]|nr:hypothetical protein [Nocardioidaceae bacterium]